jgi:hypothetical protein
MKILNRFILYIILILGYFFSTLFFFKIGSQLPFKGLFWNAFLIFCIMNIVVAFLFININPITNILVGILIAYLSLWLAFKFPDFYYPPSDAYGISTIIITNILFSIINWEIAYQIKKKYQSLLKKENNNSYKCTTKNTLIKIC